MSKSFCWITNWKMNSLGIAVIFAKQGPEPEAHWTVQRNKALGHYLCMSVRNVYLCIQYLCMSVQERWLLYGTCISAIQINKCAIDKQMISYLTSSLVTAQSDCCCWLRINKNEKASVDVAQSFPWFSQQFVVLWFFLLFLQAENNYSWK